jgi:ABC-type dipeptide/oligopeptide/nickel transport system ATPase component
VRLFAFPFLRKTITYALVGESGTGKSYQSKFVAARYKIDFIIDDGLLIKDDRILAGRSAKEESTIIAAVRAAMFTDKKRRDELARKLQTEKYRKVLILGTSEKMIRKIAARLQLPMPTKLIKIEDFAKAKEIDTALRVRRVEGKHIIPLPSAEVRKEYPSIFLDGLPIVKGKMPTAAIGLIPQSHEKSLVRPTYAVKTKIVLSAYSFSLMIINCVNEFNPHIKVKQSDVIDWKAGYRLIMTLDLPLGMRLEKNIDALKRYITDNIERFTGILIEEVFVVIDQIADLASAP